MTTTTTPNDGKALPITTAPGGLTADTPGQTDRVKQIVARNNTEMTAEQARKLTDEIRRDAETLWDKIVTAYTERAWAILGYESWDTYCKTEFGSVRLRLPREERTETVRSLRESGLSIRAIASATGADAKTVQTDLSSGVGNSYTSPEEALDAEIVETSEKTTGTDGKAYPKRKPKPKPNAKPRASHNAEPTKERTEGSEWLSLVAADPVVRQPSKRRQPKRTD